MTIECFDAVFGFVTTFVGTAHEVIDDGLFQIEKFWAGDGVCVHSESPLLLAVVVQLRFSGTSDGKI